MGGPTSGAAVGVVEEKQVNGAWRALVPLLSEME